MVYFNSMDKDYIVKWQSDPVNTKSLLPVCDKPYYTKNAYYRNGSSLKKCGTMHCKSHQGNICTIGVICYAVFGMVPLYLILFALSVPCFCQATYTIPPSKSVTIVLPWFDQIILVIIVTYKEKIRCWLTPDPLLLILYIPHCNRVF